MNEQHIKQALEQIAERDVPGDANLWPGIQTRIEQQRRPHPNHWRMRHAFLGTAASLVVLMLVFLAVPPLRTFAQQVVRQIGSVTIMTFDSEPYAVTVDEHGVTVSDIESAESITADNLPVAVDEVQIAVSPDKVQMENGEALTNEVIELPADAMLEMLDDLLSIAEASDRVGFPAYQPADLPQKYTVDARYVFDMVDTWKEVHTRYISTDDDTTLTLSQQLDDENRELVMMFPKDQPMEDVLVNGNPGLWIAGTAEIERNELMWEQDGYVFKLSSDGLTQEEMLAIAESVAP